MSVDALLDFVKIACQYFLWPFALAVAMYHFGKYRERTSKNNIHDKQIFDRIDSIVNSKEIAGIIHDAGMGYLPSNVHHKSDDLYYFNQ